MTQSGHYDHLLLPWTSEACSNMSFPIKWVPDFCAFEILSCLVSSFTLFGVRGWDHCILGSSKVQMFHQGLTSYISCEFHGFYDSSFAGCLDVFSSSRFVLVLWQRLWEIWSPEKCWCFFNLIQAVLALKNWTNKFVFTLSTLFLMVETCSVQYKQPLATWNFWDFNVS